MKRGIIRADRGYLRKEAVDDRVFSAFVEHAGNVIYNGIISRSIHWQMQMAFARM